MSKPLYLLTLISLNLATPYSFAAEPDPAVAQRAKRAYDDARKRADLQYSEVTTECQRLDDEARNACVAKAKEAHDAALNEARELHRGAAGGGTLDERTRAAYEAEIERCGKMGGKLKDSCTIDAKLRYRP